MLERTADSINKLLASRSASVYSIDSDETLNLMVNLGQQDGLPANACINSISAC